MMVMYAVSQEIRVVVVLYIANIEDLRMIKNNLYCASCGAKMEMGR